MKIIFLILMMACASHGASIGNFTADDEIWINDGGVLRASLNCDAKANVSVNVSGNSFFFDGGNMLEGPSGYYATALNLSGAGPGEYILAAICDFNGTDSRSKTITINELKADISYSGKYVLYPTDTINIQADLKENSVLVTFDSGFSVNIGDEPLEIVQLISPSQTVSRKWEIVAKAPANSSFVDNDLMKITATHDSHSVTSVLTGFSIRQPLSASIYEPSLLFPLRMVDTDNIDIVIGLKFKDGKLGINDIPHFDAALDGNALAINNVTYVDPSAWKINCNVPKMPTRSSPYELIINSEYNSFEADSVLKVQFMIQFEGKLADASGQNLRGTLRIKSAGFEEKNDITDGSYFMQLFPGTYNVELTVNKNTIKMHGIKINSSEKRNPIVYDSINNISGMDSQLIIYSKVIYPTDYIEMTLPFSGKSDNIAVFACEKWDYNERKCPGEWVEKSFNVNVEDKLVQINMSSPSAIAVSQYKILEIEASLDKQEYYMGEPMVISGTVKSEGIPEKDSQITAKLGNDVFKEATDSEGNFKIRTDAPEQKGTLKIQITAEKLPAEPASMDISANIVEKKSLTVSADHITMNYGKSVIAPIIILNNGQGKITNINCNIKGIPSPWYTLSKGENALESGKETTWNLNITLPKNCADCKDIYDVEVFASSDQATAGTSFSLIIDKPEGKAQLGITGEAIAIPDFNAIFILILFAGGAFGYRLFKSKKGYRNYHNNILKINSNNILPSQSRRIDNNRAETGYNSDMGHSPEMIHISENRHGYSRNKERNQKRVEREDFRFLADVKNYLQNK